MDHLARAIGTAIGGQEGVDGRRRVAAGNATV